MAVLLAYISVVLIWATTPLAIQWSSISLSFMAAVVLRMSLALAIALLVSAVFRRPLFHQTGVWKVYLAASIGIFPNMPVVYWSAQFIPSGLMAIIFAMSPFTTGLMSVLVLGENPFTRRRIFALLLAVAGLLTIFQTQLDIDRNAAYGIVGMLFSCLLFSLSSVWLKKLNENADAFSQTTGSLLFALPGLLLTWWWLDGELPTDISTQSTGAVLYLAVCGSLLGFTLFFFVLKRLSASVVSLITLMTPVLALLLGTFVAGEQLSAVMFAGSSLVFLALFFYLDLPLRSFALQGKWFERCLRRPAQFDLSLQDVKDEVHRYK